MKLRHTDFWLAIDRLAKKHKLSRSGLARKAGLDATCFNKSKELDPRGKPRWPSTQSIALVLNATGETMVSFVQLMGKRAC